jgi:cobalt-zinc-cadmium efflux system protein
MAALANGTTLVLIAAYIFYEAYQRFRNPPTVHTSIMLVVAVVGLIANLITMRLLYSERHNNLNVRATFFRVFGDMISSFGVIVAGIDIAIAGWKIVDPIIATMIGIIILWGSIGLVRESVDILMETVPKEIQLDRVTETIKSVNGVVELHDIAYFGEIGHLFGLKTAGCPVKSVTSI